MESKSKYIVQQWLTEKISASMGLPEEEIDPTLPLSCYGMNSVDAAGLSGELESWLNKELSPTLIWDYPTIEQLACYLSGE